MEKAVSGRVPTAPIFQNAMHIPTFQTVVRLLTVVCLLWVLPATSVAAENKFPSEDPAFTIELPRGWTSETDRNGNLFSHPPNDSEYSFTVLNLKRLQSAKS